VLRATAAAPQESGPRQSLPRAPHRPRRLAAQAGGNRQRAAISPSTGRSAETAYSCHAPGVHAMRQARQAWRRRSGALGQGAGEHRKEEEGRCERRIVLDGEEMPPCLVRHSLNKTHPHQTEHRKKPPQCTGARACHGRSHGCDDDSLRPASAEVWENVENILSTNVEMVTAGQLPLAPCRDQSHSIHPQRIAGSMARARCGCVVAVRGARHILLTALSQLIK